MAKQRPPSAPPSIAPWLLSQALALHQAGQLAQAEAAYREVLRQQPHNVDALHGLGMIALQTGHAQAAAELIGQALQAQPASADAHNHLGMAQQALGRHDDALASYDRALALRPGFAEASNNKGNTLLQLERHAEALTCFDEALAAQPAFLEATYNRGNALHGLGRAQEAVDAYASAIRLRADVPQIHHNQGRALQDLGRHDEALAAYDRAITLWPQYVGALVGRGTACASLAQPAQAADAFEQALSLDPQCELAHYGLGNALFELQRHADAVASFERCLALSPQHVDALINRGNALQAMHRHEDALASYDAATRLDGSSAGVSYNRGTALLELKRYGEAAEAFDRTLQLAADYPYAAGKRLYARMMACQWDGLSTELERLREGILAGHRVAEPFGWCGVSTSPMELRRCAETFAAHLFPARQLAATPAPRHESDRIRVGYLCGEFRNQATSILMTELFELHDKSRFELFAFDNGWDDGSTLRRRIDAAFDEVVDIASLDDEQAVQAITQRGIDLLVNLNGYFGLGRTGIFARRAAPVQVNYLGFPGTMGAPYMDYIVADERVIPAHERDAYVEQVVYLPDSYQPNDRQRAMAERTPTRDELGLRADAFVFCCFNNTYKLNPDIFALWMRLLRAVEGSVLWLLLDTEEARDNLLREARRAGVEPHRLVFAPRIRLDEHLARHRAADLFLDTLPYNAHTTASDALWAGLPVLSCRGTTFAGRVGESLLHALGLDAALLVEDLAAYERRALELATSPAVLQEINARLRERRTSARLFDAPRHCRHLEHAFEQMHWRAMSGQPPAGFAVPPLPAELRQ